MSNKKKASSSITYSINLSDIRKDFKQYFNQNPHKAPKEYMIPDYDTRWKPITQKQLKELIAGSDEKVCIGPYDMLDWRLVDDEEWHAARKFTLDLEDWAFDPKWTDGKTAEESFNSYCNMDEHLRDHMTLWFQSWFVHIMREVYDLEGIEYLDIIRY